MHQFLAVLDHAGQALLGRQQALAPVLGHRRGTGLGHRAAVQQRICRLDHAPVLESLGRRRLGLVVPFLVLVGSRRGEQTLLVRRIGVRPPMGEPPFALVGSRSDDLLLAADDRAAAPTHGHARAQRHRLAY